MFGRFTPGARRAVVQAGIGSLEAGRPRLDTDFLLLGLAEVPDAAPALEEHGVGPGIVRAEIHLPAGASHRWGDRELLAALGIDLDLVRRLASQGAAIRPDDPTLWRLYRSPARPLRVALAGPAGTLVLTGRGRKVVEVASWAAARAGGRRTPITGEHLLWGLLADGSNESVRILRRLGVDLRALWRDIRCGQTAA
jgi:hypothetical protein